MTFFDNIRMKPKLLFLFIMTGIAPLAIVALIGSYSASTALLDQAFDQLRTIQAIKRDKLHSALDERVGNLELLANSKDAQKFLEELLLLQDDADASEHRAYLVDTPEYLKIRDRHDAQLQRFIQANGFQNLYVLSRRQGHVMYAAHPEQELGTSLATGQFHSSALGRLWTKAIKTRDIVFEDFTPYAPSNGQQAAFIGYPLRDATGYVAGIIAVRLSAEFINQIMPSRQGLGESGESYLLRWHENESRFELRSDIQTLGQGRYVIGYTLEKSPSYWHDARTAGFDGGDGTYDDSTGTSVLVAYNTLDVLGVKWMLVSKINQAEVLRPILTFLLAISATGALLVAMIAPGAYQLARRISRPLEQGVRFAEAISAGDLQARLELRQDDELGMLAKSLNLMARNLREMNWLREGKAGLDDAMRGEHDPRDLARMFITYLTKYLGAQLGLVYLQQDGELVLTASYAFTNRSGHFTRVRPGEGLVGQAVLEGQILTFARVTEDAPRYNFGVDENVPAHFLAAPLLFESKPVGAFLIGSEAPFTPLQRQLVEQTVENAAILFNAASSRGVISELLRRAQEQQEMLRVANEELEEQTKMLKESQAELQAQQEEMQVTNEELAEQTKALKESESRLQEQQDELQFANDKLGERATELEEQKDAIRKKNKELLRAQEQLKLKAQELEAASRYKSEFLANMSHELRTPLNSILILSQLLGQNKYGNLSEKQIESAKAIHASGSDLLKLINEILDLSKVEAGRVELHLEDMPFSGMVADLRRVFKGVAVDKGVEFIVDMAPDLPDSLRTDGHRVQQILRNLLSNAFKFTDKGSVTLTISRPAPDANLGASGLDPASSVALAVRDMGIGIPKEKQATIFEAFRQADGGTSRKYGGTGLGLSISRELARLLGGEIQLQSAEGEGSTFTLFLPEVHASEAAGEQAPRHVEPKKAEPESAPPTTPAPAPAPKAPELVEIKDDRHALNPDDKVILIVEDDPHFARILRDQAREAGFKALLANDGETGLHFADFHHPCAIILDIGLPGINGWEVMKRLKSEPRTRPIPIHFISAEDSSMDALRQGAIGFLTKPVDVEKLQETFEHIKAFVSRPLKRLLVVDDDQLQRESIRTLIGTEDVDIVTASSGREALDLLAEQSFDCMILDLGLSDMSGFDILRTLRTSTNPPRLPIVVHTGRELSEEEEMRLKKYAESIIVKGVRSPQRLLEETTLFLHRVKENHTATGASPSTAEATGESNLAGRTILLVDDDMRNVFALSNVLEEKGLNVVVARDGLESLAKLAENPRIDLVLMDIMMPNMDGYEAMREIRKNPKHRELPIIALTAKAMKGDKNKCIEAGANEYLPKPVDTDKLVSLLKVWLYGK
ncbi:MAG: response regulator [Deltaproteobacteria bacterium]|nr:response regulator [Deltaproteobacteria bacterium]